MEMTPGIISTSAILSSLSPLEETRDPCQTIQILDLVHLLVKFNVQSLIIGRVDITLLSDVDMAAV